MYSYLPKPLLYIRYMVFLELTSRERVIQSQRDVLHDLYVISRISAYIDAFTFESRLQLVLAFPLPPQLILNSSISFQIMEQSLRKQTTTARSTSNASGSDAPSISAAAQAAGGGSGKSSSSSSSSSTVSSATCSANTSVVVAKQRPPPLKTATTTVTTTLVSSNEGGQPLPPSAVQAAGGANYRGTATLTTPSTPRIELSRASSSSHHEEDSRESSPENVFEQVRREAAA